MVKTVPEQGGTREGGGRKRFGWQVDFVLVHRDTVNRKRQERTEGLAREHGTGMERARSEVSAEEARESGGTLTAQPGRENVGIGRVGMSPGSHRFPKFGRPRQSEKSESPRQSQPEESESRRQSQLEKSESRRQCQLEVSEIHHQVQPRMSRAELLRSKPTRCHIKKR